MAVIHTTESDDNSYEAICDYLSRRGVEASAHYVVDALPRPGARYVRVSRLVPESRKAWTSRSANPVSVNYELIGRARRTRAEWLDKYEVQLRTLAILVADDVIQYGLPIRRDNPGILGHGDLDREGFPNDHTDPGAGFPWGFFFRLVEERVADAKAAPKPPVEDKPVPERNPDVLLKTGDRGSGVKLLQYRLNIVGVDPRVVADGDFGAKTRSAVATFQRHAEIPASGIYTKATDEALRSLVVRIRSRQKEIGRLAARIKTLKAQVAFLRLH